MDAFSVSLSNAMSFQPLRQREKLSMPLAFGVFQTFMPLVGFFVGSFFVGFLETIAGPLTFVILGVLGLVMIKGALDDAREERAAASEGARGGVDARAGRHLTRKLIFAQAIATSIDALGVGFSLVSYPSIDIGMAVAVIGLTTAVICLFGVELGVRLGERFGTTARVVGGVILIAIGIRALL